MSSCFYSATLLAFLLELLKSSVAMQEQMLGGKGFLVIGYLLEKVQLSLHDLVDLNKRNAFRKYKRSQYVHGNIEDDQLFPF